VVYGKGADLRVDMRALFQQCVLTRTIFILCANNEIQDGFGRDLRRARQWQVLVTNAGAGNVDRPTS